MPDEPRLLTAYRHILHNMREMLHHAEQGEWESVLEKQSKVLIKRSLLVALHEEYPVTGKDRDAVMLTFKEIQATEIDLKAKLMARRDELAALLKAAEEQNSNGGFGRVLRKDTYDRKDLTRKQRK